MSRDDDYDPVLVLVCDACGRAVHADGLNIYDFELVWQAAKQVGWHGTHHAVGPHYCQTCAPSTGYTLAALNDEFDTYPAW